MKVIITGPGVTEGRADVPIGTELEIDERNGQALIAGGYAERVEETEDPTAAAKEALDKKYNADDLKAAAKAAGVEYEASAKKADVIDAIIAAGKQGELLR